MRVRGDDQDGRSRQFVSLASLPVLVARRRADSFDVSDLHMTEQIVAISSGDDEFDDMLEKTVKTSTLEERADLSVNLAKIPDIPPPTPNNSWAYERDNDITMLTNVEMTVMQIDENGLYSPESSQEISLERGAAGLNVSDLLRAWDPPASPGIPECSGITRIKTKEESEDASPVRSKVTNTRPRKLSRRPGRFVRDHGNNPPKKRNLSLILSKSLETELSSLDLAVSETQKQTEVVEVADTKDIEDLLKDSRPSVIVRTDRQEKIRAKKRIKTKNYLD